jgi:hypothetical protein
MPVYLTETLLSGLMFCALLFLRFESSLCGASRTGFGHFTPRDGGGWGVGRLRAIHCDKKVRVGKQGERGSGRKDPPMLTFCNYKFAGQIFVSSCVTDLQGPPSEHTRTEKIRDLKSLARQYARDRGSCDDTRISYLEFVESEAEADWTLARMIAG